MLYINLIDTNNHQTLISNIVKSFNKYKIQYVINGKISDYVYIFSLTKYYNPILYPNNYFIFGPLFSSAEFKKIKTNSSNL